MEFCRLCCTLQPEAYDLWHKIEAEAGIRVLTPTGGIDVAWKECKDMKALLDAAMRNKVPLTVMNAKQAYDRFKVKIPEDFICVYQEDAVRCMA